HGIRHEKQMRVAALCPERKPQRHRIDMMAIGNDAAPDVGMIERRACKPRRTVADLAHGVEKMGDTPRTSIEALERLFRCSVAVADADDDTAIAQPAHLIRRDLLGSKRDQQGADLLCRMDIE